MKQSCTVRPKKRAHKLFPLLRLPKGKLTYLKSEEGNSDKSTEPMHMHNEAVAQHLISSGNGACSK